MSVTAAHLRELTALGIVGETLVRVVEIIDEASKAVQGQSMDKSADIRGGPLESTAEDDRKKRDKLRKRLERAAEKAAKLSAQTSSDSPRTSSDMSKDSTLSPSVVSSSLLIGQPLKKVKEEGLRARGTRLAAGAPLSAEHRTLILAEGIADPEKLWAEFVDYWSDIPGQRGVKIKWTGTLRNRCRDVIKRGFSNGHRTGNTRTTGHDAILAVAARKARELNRQDPMAGPANAAGFAFGNGVNGSGSHGNSNPAGSDQRDHHGREPDDQRIREGEIIPPDKDAAGIPRGGQFV